MHTQEHHHRRRVGAGGLSTIEIEPGRFLDWWGWCRAGPAPTHRLGGLSARPVGALVPVSRKGIFMKPLILGLVFMGVVSGCSTTDSSTTLQTESETAMILGNFSVSLAVKDIAASRAFYEKLGFEVVGGEQAQNWLVLKNGDAKIGLFQGMFDTNTLTFNPGWDSERNTPDNFADVREIQKMLQAKGIELTLTTDPDGTGPAHIFLMDPDGNPVLIDQHVDKPAK